MKSNMNSIISLSNLKFLILKVPSNKIFFIWT